MGLPNAGLLLDEDVSDVALVLELVLQLCQLPHEHGAVRLRSGSASGARSGRASGVQSGRASGARARAPGGSATLEATQGQIDGCLSQLPYKCRQNRVASMGD